MSDPFACLDPIQKPKSTIPQYGAPPAPVQPLSPSGGMYGAPVKPPSSGMGMGMGMGGFDLGLGGGMASGMNGVGMGGMNGSGMSGGGMGVGMGMGGGGMGVGMGMGGGGMGMGGMNMNIGMGMGMSMGAPSQQQQPQQQGPMYDNIKTLLAQKPKPAGAFTDDTSMDFLENLGSPKANSVTAPTPVNHAHVIDPFGPSLPVAQPLNMNVSSFDFPGESKSTSAPTSVSNTPTNGGTKSSALADRLAHGRRKTQEDQRQQLGLNAGAFAQPSSSPRISLKGMAPPAKQTSQNAIESTPVPSLDDFAAGKPVFSPSNKTNDNDFGLDFGTTVAKATTIQTSTPQRGSFFDDEGGVFSDSDADFDNKLHGHSNTRNNSGGATKQTPVASNDTFW